MIRLLPTPSAFTTEEIQAVKEWVEAGGSLFLISDHTPFPGAAEGLAGGVGLRFHNGFAFDPVQLYLAKSCLLPNEIQIFRPADAPLREHPITNGRSAAERVDSIGTFTGQAFEPAGGTEPLMVFGPAVVRLLPTVARQFQMTV